MLGPGSTGGISPPDGASGAQNSPGGQNMDPRGQYPRPSKVQQRNKALHQKQGFFPPQQAKTDNLMNSQGIGAGGRHMGENAEDEECPEIDDENEF